MLVTRTLDLTLREIFKSLRRRARRAGVCEPRAGAISFVQRFGGALNLNVHFHCVIPDGVFARGGGKVGFSQLGALSDDEVKAVLLRIVTRLLRLLRPRADAAATDSSPPDTLTLAQAESLLPVASPPPAIAVVRKLTAFVDGFSLHAGVHLHANDRQGLEHLCGYGARPALSLERLGSLPDGRLTYRLKRPLGDGRNSLVLDPLELLRRLATLVPPPRRHLVRFHGVFAPNSSWRREVIPAGPESTLPPLCNSPDPQPASREELEAPTPLAPRPSRIPWSELLLRVFREDVLLCPCGGRRLVLAFVTAPQTVRAILEHLGLPATGPPIASARFTRADGAEIWQDDVPELQQSLR